MNDMPGDSEDLLGEEKPRRRWRWPWQWRWGRAPGMEPLPGEAPARPRRRYWRIALITIVVLLVIYYPLGALWVNKIDDDPDFQAGDVAPGGSNAIAMAAALIDREVNRNGWPANDPFFLPGSMLDNMPNYQIGIIQALGRFAVEMTDQIGRTRGSSQADPDPDRAAGLLKYSPRVWIF